MRKFLGLFIALCLLFTCFCTYAASSIAWQSYSKDVFNQAKKDHKLVLLFAEATWCHWCQLMNKTYEDADIISVVNKNYIPIKINIDKEKDLVKKYRVAHLPTNIIMDANQKEISHSDGYMTAEQFIMKLDDAVNSQENS